MSSQAARRWEVEWLAFPDEFRLLTRARFDGLGEAGRGRNRMCSRKEMSGPPCLQGGSACFLTGPSATSVGEEPRITS